MAMESKTQLQFDSLPLDRKIALARKSIFTTGEIALLCGVAPRSASKWFDAGHFPLGYRLPNTTGAPLSPEGLNGDRRVPRDDLIAFVKQHKILRAIELLCPQEVGPAVLVGLAPSQVGMVASRLPPPRELIVAHTLVEGAVAIARSKNPPMTVVIHSDNPVSQIKALADYAEWRAKERGVPCHIVVLYPDNYAVPDASMPAGIEQKPEGALLSLFVPETEVA